MKKNLMIQLYDDMLVRKKANPPVRLYVDMPICKNRITVLPYRYIAVGVLLLITLSPYYPSTGLYADMEKNAEEKAKISYIAEAKSKKQKIAFHIATGNDHLMRGEYSHAIVSYNDARKLKEKNPETFFRLGEAYRMADMPAAALESYNKALKYGAKNIGVFLGLAGVYKSKFLYEKSEEYYKKIFNIEENNLAAMKGLAEIYEYRGDYGNALKLYEKVFSIETSDKIKSKLFLLSVLLASPGNTEKYINSLPESRVLAGYLSIKSNPMAAIDELASVNEYFLQAVAYLKINDNANAGKNLKILISQKENTLSKRLAIALNKSIK